MPGAPTGPRTENRACLRKVHFWRVLTSKPSDWFYTSWDSLLSQETLSEPFWSDSPNILLSSKYTFFICICISQATIKTATEKVYVLYLHTPISGAKPALLCTVPDLVRSIKTPLRRLHLTLGFHAEHGDLRQAVKEKKLKFCKLLLSFYCRASETHATARFSPEKLKFCKLLFKTVIESLTTNTLSLEVEVL